MQIKKSKKKESQLMERFSVDSSMEKKNNHFSSKMKKKSKDNLIEEDFFSKMLNDPIFGIKNVHYVNEELLKIEPKNSEIKKSVESKEQIKNLSTIEENRELSNKVENKEGNGTIAPKQPQKNQRIENQIKKIDINKINNIKVESSFATERSISRHANSDISLNKNKINRRDLPKSTNNKHSSLRQKIMNVITPRKLDKETEIVFTEAIIIKKNSSTLRSQSSKGESNFTDMYEFFFGDRLILLNYNPLMAKNEKCVAFNFANLEYGNIPINNLKIIKSKQNEENSAKISLTNAKKFLKILFTDKFEKIKGEIEFFLSSSGNLEKIPENERDASPEILDSPHQSQQNLISERVEEENQIKGSGMDQQNKLQKNDKTNNGFLSKSEDSLEALSIEYNLTKTIQKNLKTVEKDSNHLNSNNNQISSLQEDSIIQTSDKRTSNNQTNSRKSGGSPQEQRTTNNQNSPISSKSNSEGEIKSNKMRLELKKMVKKTEEKCLTSREIPLKEIFYEYNPILISLSRISTANEQTKLANCLLYLFQLKNSHILKFIEKLIHLEMHQTNIESTLFRKNNITTKVTVGYCFPYSNSYLHLIFDQLFGSVLNKQFDLVKFFWKFSIPQFICFSEKKKDRRDFSFNRVGSI